MSGDVQPRKRKDKKRKKDELGFEEAPRGTAAVFGEGDVFIHSHHDHGTGGHWCAKIIFFSLLAILITLIGLIILENRGLSELEANSVESRYSGVLEGWLEEAPEDDHHDEHTLELKHHDHDQGVHDDDLGDIDEDDHDKVDDDHDEADDDDHDEAGDDDHDEADDDDDEADDDDDGDDYGETDDDEQHDDEDSQERDLGEADDEDEDESTSFKKYLIGDNYENQKDNSDEEENDDDDDENQTAENNSEDDDDDEPDEDIDVRNFKDDDLKKYQYDSDEVENDNDNERSIGRDDDDDEDDYIKRLYYNERDDSGENANHEDDDHEKDEEDDEPELEMERIEREPSDEEPISTELPPLPEADDDDDDDKNDSKDGDDDENVPDADDDDADDNDSNEADDDDDDEEYLEQDIDDDEPPIERITAPSGKPFDEVEDETSSEKPPDTLEEEEEYEKRQEELRLEEERASHMWLKLGVGGALLLATHAIMRRATGPRDVPPTDEDSREETPLPDRRMTLIPEEPPTPEISRRESGGSDSEPIIEQLVKKIPSITKSAPTPKQLSDEEDEQEEPEEDVEPLDTKDKELYSDDEEPEEEFEPEIVKKIVTTEKKPDEKSTLTQEEEEDPDDVEIIDDEQIEEEFEEEDDEISDVDDEELLTRLEAKYGRLPEPERPAQKHKDGGNSLEDEWPGEPSDAFWRQQLDSAEQEIRQGGWLRAAERLDAAELRGSARARHLRAQALDRAAESKQDNRLLTTAIAAYLELLRMHEKLSDKQLLQVTERVLDRIKFRGTYMSAEPVYRLLIRRFPDDVLYRNNLTVSFLMANRADLAAAVLKETLKKWPDDRVALAHYGFVLKTEYNKLEEAVDAFQKALEGDKGSANEPRFYYHLGDSLLLLGRFAEAHEVHKRGAALGHFLSPAQRSLYNVPRLRSKPWWNVENTPYLNLARSLEKSWREILKEGVAARAIYEKEKEGLKERGKWSQLDLFVRGREIPGRCSKAPVTCNVIKQEPAAAGCRRGQVKFSLMEAGTHVRPHVGPTNCRLRMHLGLSNTKDTYIRVDKEIRQWQTGKVFMFDDSFEHEVWHNGTGARLVLIVDVWHPELTREEARRLPAI